VTCEKIQDESAKQNAKRDREPQTGNETSYRDDARGCELESREVGVIETF
jgi:hypothetical protein